jgi:hypothetical protein
MKVLTALRAVAAALRSRLRQLWTMLALMPWAIATCATEAPGWAQSARIFVLSSGLCWRRVRLGVVVIVSITLLMDTIVVGYDFAFKMGWPGAYQCRTSHAKIHGVWHPDKETLIVVCLAQIPPPDQDDDDDAY